MCATLKLGKFLSLPMGLILLAAPAARAEGPPSLDEAILKNAPRIIDYLKKHSYKNTGVLKFLVQADGGRSADSVGPLNRSLADRLQVALILANDDPNLGFLTHASDSVAETGVPVTHRTAEGRERFFQIPLRSFKRAWGKLTDGPDCFLTGEARLSADMRTVGVKVQAFGKDDAKNLVTVCEFEAATDSRTLGEAGMRFLRSRGGLSAADIKKALEKKEVEKDYIATVTPAAASNKDLAIKLETRLKEEKKVDPIEFTILYNGKPVERNAAGVPTPDERVKKVQFRLTNRDEKATYGVVLVVNGENTIFREDQGPPLEMYKWVIKPTKSITIDGYQLDQQKCEEFKVLPPRESEERAVHYGKDAGVINLWVFRGIGKDETEYAKYEAPKAGEGALLVSKGLPKPTADAPPPKDLEALKTTLHERLRAEEKSGDNGPRSKGLIVPGQQLKSDIVTTPFKADSNVVKFDTIYYFQPSK